MTVVYYPFFWVQMAMAVALNSISKKQFSKMEVTEELELISDRS